MEIPLWIEKARRGISYDSGDQRMVDWYSIGKTESGNILILAMILVALTIFVIYMIW